MEPARAVNFSVNGRNASFAFISSEKAIGRCMIKGVMHSELKVRPKMYDVVWRAANEELLVSTSM